MTTKWIAIAAVSMLVACSSGEKAQTDQPEQSAESAATQTEAPADMAESHDMTSGQTEVAAVTLAGTLGCGHCTHHIGDACSAALQTAEGEVYILDEMGEGDAPFDQRTSGQEITVVGTVTTVDGVHHVQVESFEL